MAKKTEQKTEQKTRASNKSAIDWGSIDLESSDRKIAVSIRLDEEVLEYFKGEGKGYQTRINTVLRSFILAHKNSKS